MSLEGKNDSDSMPNVRIVPENHHGDEKALSDAFKWTTAHNDVGVQDSSPVAWGNYNDIDYFAYVVANKTIEISTINNLVVTPIDRLTGIHGEVDFISFCPRKDVFVVVVGGETGLHAWNINVNILIIEIIAFF